MGQAPEGSSTEAILSEAYATARELLRRAEEDAAGIRADADRYLRQRQQEAELVVGKARRMLAIAEERAASIEAAATVARTAPPAVAVPVVSAAPTAVPPAVDRPPATIDLTAPRVPAAVTDASADRTLVPSFRRSASDLDRVLADAVHRAIDRALPTDP